MSDTAKESDRLAFLGRLAGGLAHEIKNPLSTMMVTLQLLKEDWAGRAEEPRERRTAQKIDLMLKEVNRLEGILNEFLRYARGAERELEEVDLNEVIQSVLDFVEPEAEKYDVRIRFQGDAASPRCRVEPNLFKQALLNLVINAQHAMEESGGELMVTTTVLSDESQVRVRLVDTGQGIPPEQLDKVFDVYYSTKRRGTGLGLPTAKRFIEEFDGSIQLHSEVGRGTIVNILLPLAG